eukprot:1176046-Prorocentrum_minimum.AAC.2
MEKNLVIALGWSLHLCITQHPLFYDSNSELGSKGVPSVHPMYCTILRPSTASALMSALGATHQGPYDRSAND